MSMKSCVGCDKRFSGSQRQIYCSVKCRKRLADRRRRAAKPNLARERTAKYRSKNPEKARESNRRWKAANPEKVRQKNRRYYIRNQEKIKERDRRRRDQQRIQKRMGYAANPEKKIEQVLKYQAAQRAQNPHYDRNVYRNKKRRQLRQEEAA